MSTPSSELPIRYQQALDDYLTRGDEAPLHEAYELGRKALALDIGLLGLVKMHEAATSKILELKEKPANALPDLQAAADQFLIESLASFEMMQIGHRDANSSLHKLNHILEEETKRIALLLHDEAAQLLASVYLELAEIKRAQPGEGVVQRVERVKSHLDQVRAQLRHISHELRPPLLDRLGLMPALYFLAHGLHKRTGLAVDIQRDRAYQDRFPRSIETILYRVVLEALNNIVEHAQATHVRINVWSAGRSVFCTVEDDGVGFNLSSLGSNAMPGGLGLLGIQERINSLHGTLNINSASGAGTTLRMVIPLEESTS